MRILQEFLLFRGGEQLHCARPQSGDDGLNISLELFVILQGHRKEEDQRAKLLIIVPRGIVEGDVKLPPDI